jgi:hypothetical protein
MVIKKETKIVLSMDEIEAKKLKLLVEEFPEGEEHSLWDFSVDLHDTLAGLS